MQRLLRDVCHKDVRAVKDSAIVLSADRVETLDAEPTALGPGKGVEKKKAVSLWEKEVFFPTFFLLKRHLFNLL